jgi:hypothetical protein
MSKYAGTMEPGGPSLAEAANPDAYHTNAATSRSSHGRRWWRTVEGIAPDRRAGVGRSGCAELRLRQNRFLDEGMRYEARRRRIFRLATLQGKLERLRLMTLELRESDDARSTWTADVCSSADDEPLRTGMTP